MNGFLLGNSNKNLELVYKFANHFDDFLYFGAFYLTIKMNILR